MWCRLKQAGELRSGYAFKSNEYVETGIQVVRISDLDNDTILTKNAVYYPSNINFDAYLIKKDSILICLTGSIGKMAWVTDDVPRYLNQRVGMFIHNKTCCTSYLWAFLQTNYVLYQWIAAKTSANGNIKNSDVTNLLFPVPPLAEQARIVVEIEKFEPLIAEYDKLERQATKLDDEIYDKLKKSILQYAIQGKLVEQDSNDEPASVLLERIRAEKKAKLGKKYVDSYIYKGDDNCYYEHIATRAQDELVEVPFDIPDNWVWSKLLDVLDVRDGTHDTPKYVDVGFPLVTSKNLNNGTIDFSTTKNISEQDLNNINLRSKVDEGDILFAMIGSIGNPVQVRNIERPFAIKNMALFKSQNTAINMEYAYYFLMISQNEMKKSASGAVQAFVSLNYLRNYYIPIPPLTEQNRIVAKIKKLLSLCERLK